MEKKQAIQLISDTFNAKFDENKFSLFIKNLLNDIEPKTNRYSGQMLWDDYKDHINSYKRIGKYTDPEGVPLDILIVEVKTIAKLERARTSLRNFVIKHLKKFDKDFALVAFYAEDDNGVDWRFSFIKLEHQSYFDEEKDKVKIKEELTPAKRYSFLVGEHEQSHTAKTQLLPLLQNLANNPTVEELENAFSIEKVTDEFFEQYKLLFEKLYGHFDGNDHIKAELKKAGIDNARFTKKLLGQIVFLYFLQKKGWLGVPKNEKWGEGQRRFIQNLFDTAQQEDANFFKDKLQYLFYEALAKERNNKHSFYEKFDCRIPFLNGGLFEAEYLWETANITIPQHLFRSEELKEDERTGILDVFDRYNFTIKEDEPLDKEVAVDPEMLGKVFENMLEITERKRKGAFYTPREIVHYMCQESLIHYLDNALDGKVKKQDIETYIRKGHNALENDKRVAKKGEETATYKYILPKSIRQNADLIDQKLIDIKICDPAIGSGAFPVGLLHELVNAQLVIKPHFSDNYLKAKLKEFQFTKKETPSESRYIYRLKRHIIQESIYGVDIDASAIDIARLRLWLSLVVDEDDFDPIETLPNLDYKIVCGNSLISRYGLDMSIENVFAAFNKKVKDKDYPHQEIKKLIGNKDIDLAYYKKLTNDFLLESSHDKKVLFRELITEIKSAFKTVLGEKDKEKLSKARGAVENLQQSDIFGKQVGTKTQISNAKKHFVKLEKEKKETQDGALYKNAIEWRFEFPNLLDKNGGFVGFDVVIGNPPYGVKFNENEKDLLKIMYPESQFKIDSYSLFILRGLLNARMSGYLSYIIPSTLMDNFFEENVRNKIINYNKLDLLVELNDKIFDTATVHSMIIGVESTIPENDYLIRTSSSKKLTNIYTEIPKSFFESQPQKTFAVRNFDFKTILHKLNINSEAFNTVINLRQAIKSGNDTKYIVEEKLKQNYKPILGGKHIKKWEIKNPNLYINYGKHLACPRNPKIFEQPKILLREAGNKITATIDNDNYYIMSSLYNGILINNNFRIKYVLSLLNSEIYQFLMNLQTFSKTSGAFTKAKIFHYYDLPIKSVDVNEQRPFEILVDYIITLKTTTKEIECLYFETLLDAIVYELYFEQELKQANKEVLKHLSDLKPINDKMNEEEKLAIIQSEFERLYHPEHPVRFAVETLDSIEEVRIIKEALR